MFRFFHKIPQFCSVFLCEAILYDEMSFGALYDDMRIIGASLVLPKHEIPHQINGEYENHKEMLPIQGIS